jgi:hypothetical protein
MAKNPLRLKKLYKRARHAGLGRREAFRNALRVNRDSAAFIRQGGKIDEYLLFLDEATVDAGTASGHYFHQDLLVAKEIYTADPKKHLDIGSRIDGFVAHVASFRDIDVMDIRPLINSGHSNIHFIQADLMQPQPQLEGVYDSVSCLHALEHFGLGRYGDPIDPEGHKKGFAAISRLVALGGTLYISFPVGRPKVVFNAHRVFSPSAVLEWGAGQFTLQKFYLVNDMGDIVQNATVQDASDMLYGCGIYVLKRNA